MGGISDNGQSITGTYFDSDFVFHGFILNKDGDFITIDVPGAAGTLAVRFSSKGGKVTGSYEDGVDPTIRHGFIATPLENYGLGGFNN